MNPIVSLQQIAAHAGVSKGTVSLALRNNPRISAETRALVRASAEALGYRPNPAVAAWMAHRRRLCPQTGGESLAFINSWLVRNEWAAAPWFTRFVDGARVRATALGFGFEEYWLAECGMTPVRMEKILRARGVRGMLIGSLPVNACQIKFGWANFAAVAQGHSLAEPELSRSVCDYAHAMQLALCKLGELGYQRIGYISAANLEARTQRLNLSAYLGYQATITAGDRIPILEWVKQSPKELGAWVRQVKPDAIVSHDLKIQDLLREIGVRIPQDIGVAALCLHPDSPPLLAGIDQCLERCGEVAVDLLVSHLHHNEVGPPSQPIIALTRGVWKAGETV